MCVYSASCLLLKTGGKQVSGKQINRFTSLLKNSKITKMCLQVHYIYNTLIIQLIIERTWVEIALRTFRMLERCC